VNITADVPLKLNKPVDATDLTEAVKEYTIPSRQTADGISVPISPVTLVDATRDPIRQYSAFNWDSIPVKTGVTADPAAGAQLAAVTVPASKRWRVTAMQCTLVAAAVVITRTPQLHIRMTGAAPDTFLATGHGVTTGETVEQSFCAGSLVTAADSAAGVHFPVMELGAGAVFLIDYFNLQGADNISAMTYFYKEAPL
jgi:hypothetical protein